MASASAKVKLVVVLVGGFLFGALPFLWWLGSVRVGRIAMLAWAAVVGLVASALGVWRAEAEIGPARRRWWEFALAGVSVSGYPAVYGAFAAGAYLAVYWAVRAANAMFDWTLSRQTAPFWTALVFFFVFAGLVWIELPRSTVRRLYPDPLSGEGRSLYADVLKKLDREALLGILGAGLLGALSAVISTEAAPYVAASMLIIVIANQVTPRARIEASASLDEVEQAVHVVEEAFRSAGFDCIAYPRTGDEPVDALLGSVHLAAFSRDCALVVEVVIGVPGASLAVDQIDPIVIAAWTLEDKLEEVERVWPVLVLVDVAIDDTVRRHAEERQLSLLVPGGNGMVAHRLPCSARLIEVEAGLTRLAGRGAHA